MKPHLTEDEILEFMALMPGAPRPEHLAECAECERRVSVLSGALGGFRESAIAWAAMRQPAVKVPAAPGWWQPRPLWALAVVAVALIAAVPTYRHYSAMNGPVSADNPAADAALLRQVDAQISRSVPGPMEPLLSLVEWNTGATETTGSNQ